jgi:hypothetical protein
MLDTEHKLLNGGEFLITETVPSNVFMIEDFYDVQNLVFGMVYEFVDF